MMKGVNISLVWIENCGGRKREKRDVDVQEINSR